MGLSKESKNLVISTICESIKRKLLAYNPETTYRPFHDSILGTDRMNLYSFIHSINTTMGISIYEPVAKALGQFRFEKIDSQVSSYNKINNASQEMIQRIVNELETGERTPNKDLETEEIRKVILEDKEEDTSNIKLIKADIWIRESSACIHLIDIKTVKPNKGDFSKFKRLLLEWVASELTRDPYQNIKTYIGFPYNPYYPYDYNRWTVNGMLDIKTEVLVADQLWDFIGGEGTYKDILDCFDQAGNLLKDEIDQYFNLNLGE